MLAIPSCTMQHCQCRRVPSSTTQRHRCWQIFCYTLQHCQCLTIPSCTMQHCQCRRVPSSTTQRHRCWQIFCYTPQHCQCLTIPSCTMQHCQHRPYHLRLCSAIGVGKYSFTPCSTVSSGLGMGDDKTVTTRIVERSTRIICAD